MEPYQKILVASLNYVYAGFFLCDMPNIVSSSVAEAEDQWSQSFLKLLNTLEHKKDEQSKVKDV